MADEDRTFDATATAGTGATVTIGGKQWTLSPLTFEDEKEFAEWVRGKILDGLRAVADRGLPVTGSMIVEALTPTTPTGLVQWRFSPEGLIKTVELSLRHKHPDITAEKVAELINNCNELVPLVVQIDRMQDEVGRGAEGNEQPAAESG